jgi:hypothetical protein
VAHNISKLPRNVKWLGKLEMKKKKTNALQLWGDPRFQPQKCQFSVLGQKSDFESFLTHFS